MIQSIPCPGCHRTLILAANASLQATLRCRHCSHQFVLGEMIESELGFWEVVDDPQAPEPTIAPKSSPIQAITEDNAADGEITLANEPEYVSPQALLKQQANKKNVDWSKFEPITHEQFERMRRKSKSPVWSTLSVLLGGLASLPIAALLIWHVLGKDPLQLGPVVGRYVPWIVPEKFRPFAAQDFATPREAPAAGQSGFRKFDTVLNEAEPEEPMPAAMNFDQAGQGSGMIPSRNMRMRDRRIPGAHPQFESTGGRDAGREQSSVAELEPTAPATPENVFKLINETEKSLESWSERSDDRETNKLLAKQIYSQLTNLALAVDSIPEKSPLRRLVRNELLTIGKTVEEQRELQQLIQAGARFWIASQESETQFGVASVIEIAEVSESAGKWQITATPQTALGTPSFTITAPIEIAPGLVPGQQLFVLGVVTNSQVSTNEASESSNNQAEGTDDADPATDNATNADVDAGSADSKTAETAAATTAEAATEQTLKQLEASFLQVLESSAK